MILTIEGNQGLAHTKIDEIQAKVDISKDAFNHSNGNDKKKVNTVIKTLFYDLSDDDLHDTLDTLK